MFRPSSCSHGTAAWSEDEERHAMLVESIRIPKRREGIVIRILTQKQSDSQFTMTTEGLSTFGQLEIRIEFHDSELIEDGKCFLSFVSDYVTSGAKLRAGETMGYGYWATKFEDGGEQTLETWEYNAEATELIRGVTHALRYWRDQNATCKKYSAAFEPPRADRRSVISKGVFEGLPVQGVRYCSPDHMSGWWITTDQYDGDVNSLMNEHSYHLTAARPDLAKYLALPHGFRFDTSQGEDVWFEEEVATELTNS